MSSANADYSAFDPHAAAEEIGISKEAYLRLCGTFVRTTRKDLENLQAALEAGNIANAATAAHQIKGAARNMEFEAIAAIAEQLQHADESWKTQDLKELCDQLAREFDAAAAVIARYV